MEEIFVPASVREVGDRAFEGCGSLRAVRFPQDSRLERLGEGTFAYSGLRAFTVPAGLRAIERNVFLDCRHLRAVRFAPGSRLERVGEDAFAGVPAEVRLPGRRRRRCAAQ